MERRSLLSRLGGGLAVTAAAGLAGCSGDESTDSTPSEAAATDTGTAADTASDSTMGETPNESPSDGMPAASAVSGEVESSVDGLSIADHRVGMPAGLSQPDGAAFNLSLTVENSGGSETNPTDYDYELGLFDADGTDITPIVTAVQPNDIEIAPGERGTIALSGLFESDSESGPDDVARYEVSLSCNRASEGVYCDG